MIRIKRPDMLAGKLIPNILLFSIPLLLSGILQLLFNAVDMVVVGRYSGPEAMAAVSSTSALISLLTNFFIGLSVGTSVCIAKRLGKRDYEEIQQAVHTSVLLGIIAGGMMTITGIIFCRRFLQLMGSPADVIDLSAVYLRFYFTGMVAVMVYNFVSAILRARGDTRRPLYALVMAGIMNLILNLFFVLVLKINVAGVGLASSLANYLAAFLVLLVLIRDEGFMHLDIRHLYLDKSALKEIIAVGLPAAVQSTLFNISNVAIQSSINSFGKIIMAGNGAASSLSDFVYNIMTSFYHSCLTFTSQNIGAGRRRRVRRILSVSEFLVFVFGFCFGQLVYIFGDTLLRIYSSDPQVIAAGMIRLAIMGRSYFLCGMMDVLVGSLRGMGSSFVPMIVSLLGICAFRLLWIATYFASHRTIEVLYLSYPLSWIITMAVHFLTWLVVYHRLIRREGVTQ